MKIPINWLRDFVDVDVDARELGHRLTLSGFEVESLEFPGAGLEPITVAQVVTKEKHPNADRLSLCSVSIGTQELQIVCGATNFKAGDKVVLALPGTVLPGGHKLEKSKIRGVVSNGMMCSERELGLSSEASGLILLPEDAPVGQPFIKYYGMDEAVLDLNVAPNRADCLSIIGIAREVATLLGKPLRLPAAPACEAVGDPDVAIAIEDPAICPLYTGCRISGVKIGPSPLWMQNRLRSVGLRPISNVVDVTNYVLIETGQPLHAFDARRIEGSRILVRAAREGEKVITLDGKERLLPAGAGVIADGARAVAVAGVMGLQNTEISDACTEVFLESAYFNPRRVRATSKALGLVTDASRRLERGVDPETTVLAARRAAAMIAEVCGGRVASALKAAGPGLPKPPRVALRAERIERLLGMAIDAGSVRSILGALGFSVGGTDAVFDVGVPTWRTDVTEEADLIEEVARIYGYDRIVPPDSRQTVAFHPPCVRADVESLLREACLGLGLAETVHYSFISHREGVKTGLLLGHDPKRVVRVLNPVNQEMGEMRTSLLCGAVDNLRRNFHRGQNQVRICEFGKTFAANPGAPEPAYRETRRLAVGLLSARKEKVLLADPDIAGFFDMKGLVEAFALRLGLRGALELSPLDGAAFIPGQCVQWKCGETVLGMFGALSPETVKALDLMGEAAVAELDLDALETVAGLGHAYHPVSRYPQSVRDLALVVDEGLAWGDIRRGIEALGIGDLEQVTLFDEFRGDKIGAGRKSLAFSMRFRSAGRTLGSEDVDRLVARIVETLGRDFRCEVRIC